MTILCGDSRAILPTLDLSGAVVITDPPWPSGVGIDIAGAGAPADARSPALTATRDGFRSWKRL